MSLSRLLFVLEMIHGSSVPKWILLLTHSPHRGEAAAATLPGLSLYSSQPQTCAEVRQRMTNALPDQRCHASVWWLDVRVGMKYVCELELRLSGRLEKSDERFMAGDVCRVLAFSGGIICFSNQASLPACPPACLPTCLHACLPLPVRLSCLTCVTL